MPNLIAHRLFIDALIGDHVVDSKVREALRLGTQGPDPLFYHGIIPWHSWHYLTAMKKIGNRLHKENGTFFFSALIKEFSVIKDENEKNIFGGFIMGQLAHLYLDRAEHPFIYYFSSFDLNGHLTGYYHYSHADYESKIDSLLAQMYPEFDYRNETEDVLPFDNEIYAVIDKYLVPAVEERYGWKLSKKYYTNSIINMRTMQKLTRNKILKSLGKTNMFNALYTPEHVDQDILNLEHVLWFNPVTGEKSQKSFIDIFRETIEEARSHFEVYFNDGLNKEIVLSAIKDCDYRGVIPNSKLLYNKDRPFKE